VVLDVTKEEERNITVDALFAGVILARARLPVPVILDMVLPRWVLEAEESDRHGRNWVFAVGDTGKGVQLVVSQIGKLLVSNAGQPVSVEPDDAVRDLEFQVDGVEEGDGSSKGMSDCSDGIHSEVSDGSIYRSKDVLRGEAVSVAEPRVDSHARTNAREEGGVQVDGNGVEVGKEWNDFFSVCTLMANNDGV